MRSNLLIIVIHSLIIIGSISAQNTQTDKIIFGYLPDWEYNSNYHLDIRYDLLTHLAVFPFTFDSSGEISYPYRWQWNDVVSQASEYNVKLIMSIAEFDSNQIRHLFQNEATKQNFINEVKNCMQLFKFEGVNIDFEHLYDEDEGEPVINFMREFTDSIKSFMNEAEISYATPIINWNNDWQLEELADICDYLFIMGYGFAGRWSSTTGPTSPLSGGYNNLSTALEDDYGIIAANNPGKLLLGLPYYGEHWIAESGSEGGEIKNYVSWVPYREISEFENNAEYLWSDYYEVSWFRWQDNNSDWHQVWIDTEQSLSRKIELIIEKKLGGMGIWALGYDYGNDNLWGLIQEKFYNVNSITYTDNIPTQIKLLQNFPNPFNPSTTISYYLPEAGYIDLSVFDILGRKVKTLFTGYSRAGWNRVTWNSLNEIGQKISTGCYFYTLISENIIFRRKMVFIK